LTERAAGFTAVLDANVLAGALTRNILLSLAEAGHNKPRFSIPILDEVERYLLRRLDESTAKRQRNNIETAFPEAIVEGLDPLIDRLDLPDADDRHVLACAIRTGAARIVTENEKDFPADVLSTYELQTVRTDDFVANIVDLAGPGAIAALRRMRERFERPEIDADELIQLMEIRGLAETAKLLGKYRELL